MIPKIIHFIWFGDNPPLISRKWRDLHPDYEIFYWTDNNIFDFKNHILYKYLEVIKNPMIKSDIARIIALDIYGGIYVDVDMTPERSLDEFLNWKNILIYENEFYRSQLIMNGFIGATKDSLFIDKLVKRLLIYDPEKLNNLNEFDIWKVTGPGLITDVWQDSEHRHLMIFPSWFCNIAHNDPKRLNERGYLISERFNSEEYGITPNGEVIDFLFKDPDSIMSFRKYKKKVYK